MNQGKRRAIIDIGSNSVRLVVYGGAPRAPVALYNEKLSAGLGRGVVATGALDDKAAENALAALARFATLVKLMQVDSVRAVATAAVREASNGNDFVDKVEALGIPVEILDGDAEAVASGLGVISSIQDADGIAADLGGGSLELARIKAGEVLDRVSLPLGILRVAEIRGRGESKLAKQVKKAIGELGWFNDAKNLPLYLVGGSWRALARLHIHQTQFPLPVITNHQMPSDAADMLLKYLKNKDVDELKAVPRMPYLRIPMLGDSAALLAVLSRVIEPSHFVVCASGLREGLLYQSLSVAEQAEDPLIAGARFTADQQRRFPDFGEALARWLHGLFGDEGEALVRLRHAACLLADLGWTSNPEFRAISGEELALHGNWVGVTAEDRTILAMALFASFSGSNGDTAILEKLAPTDALAKAKSWGLAIRVAQRLGGGSAAALARCSLLRDGDRLVLNIDPSLIALNNSSVQRRLGRLADMLNLKAEITSD